MPDEPAPPGSFWSSVRWPQGEMYLYLGVMVVLGVAVGIFRPDPFYEGGVFLVAVTGFFVALGSVGWVLYRVFLAWIRWPSQYRIARWFKTAVAFMLTDPDHRYRD